MPIKKYSNYKPDFLKLVHEQRTNKGETGMCMLMAYSTLIHGIKDLPVSLINQHPENIYAVHGMISNAEGKRFWHAWIEIKASDKNTVFDPINGIFDDKKHWYKLTHAKPEYQLTKPQYMKLVKKYGHAGYYTKEELQEK